VFLEGHFLFISSDTLLYDASFSHNSQQKPNRRKFSAWNNHGQRGHAATAILDEAFSQAVRFCSYTVRRKQYDRPS